MTTEVGDIGWQSRNLMEWNSTFKNVKEMETKSMMDVALMPTVETLEGGLTPEKGNLDAYGKPRRKSMTTVYLKFFETAPDGKSRRCIFCKQSYSITTSTGNLGRHLNHRHPGYDHQGDDSQQIPQSMALATKPEPNVKPVTLDFDNLNWLMLKWFIGASIHPPAFEDEGLLNSFKFLNPSAKLWPKEKVHVVTLEIFRSMREDVKASLEYVNSKVSITLDFWSSYEQLFYMGIKCHWIDENWSLCKVLLDVVHIPYPCTGPEIFHALMAILHMFNIDKKVLSYTHDGSPHAVHACHALKEELDARKVTFCYVPCAARTLNLIIEDGLRSLKPLLSKIREFALEMNTVPEIAQYFKQLTAIYQEGSWEFPLDTSASWNGDYTLLDIVRKAPNSMDTTVKKHEEAFGTRNLLLTTTDKTVVNILHPYLETFHKITSNICTCKVPTVGLMLFFMDHVFEMISTCRQNSRHEWLKSIADDMAKSTRSFSTQAHTICTFMSAVLDPRIKKELISDNLNSDKNLEEARGHFTRSYATSHFSTIGNGFGAHDAEEEANVVSFAEEIARKRRRGNTSTSLDELSQYLSEPPLSMDTDILDWWKANSARYPCLSVMARDYLAVQGTSVEPDELFSSKCGEVLKRKFCLPFGSRQALMCISSWVKNGFKLKYRSNEIDFEKLVESGTC